MPHHSLFACPECKLQRVVETDRTHPSPPVLPTVANPEPAMPHQERDRYCLWCGAEWRTTEVVAGITKHGDPARIKSALAAASDETAKVESVLRMILSGVSQLVKQAREMIKSNRFNLADDGQRRLFDSKDLDA